MTRVSRLAGRLSVAFIIAVVAVGTLMAAPAAAETTIEIAIVGFGDQDCTNGTTSLRQMRASSFSVEICASEDGSPIPDAPLAINVVWGDGTEESVDVTTDADGVVTADINATKGGTTTVQVCDGSGTCSNTVELSADEDALPPPEASYEGPTTDVGPAVAIADDSDDFIDAYTGDLAEAGSGDPAFDLQSFQYLGATDGVARFRFTTAGDVRSQFEEVMSFVQIGVFVETPDDRRYNLWWRKTTLEEGGSANSDRAPLDGVELSVEWEDESTGVLVARGVDVPPDSLVRFALYFSLDGQSSGYSDQVEGTVVPDDSALPPTDETPSDDPTDTPSETTGTPSVTDGGSGTPDDPPAADDSGFPWSIPILIGLVGGGIWLWSRNRGMPTTPSIPEVPSVPSDPTPGTGDGPGTSPPAAPGTPARPGSGDDDTTSSTHTPTPEPITVVPAPVQSGDDQPKISIVSNGGTDSVHQYQMFRVIVEIPDDGTPPPEEIDIEIASGDDTETLTVAWDGNVGGPARYVSQPITLDKGAQGEGKSTWFGTLEFAVGGFSGLDFDNGESISISYDGATAATTAYDSWVDQGIGRCIIVTEWWRRYWTNLLEQLEGVESPDADEARTNAKRGLEWAGKARNWFERDDILDTKKLAYLELYANNIGSWFSDPREAYEVEGGFFRAAEDKELSYRSRAISDGMAQVAIGMYRTVTEATWAAAGFTVFGTTIMGVQATWDERVLAAVELAGWATLGLEASGFAGGVSRGSFLDEATDVATGGGRTTRGVDGAADAAGITRHADEATDPFSSSQWARVAYSPNRTRATGNGPDFDPVGSMDDVGAPRGITGGTRSQATADATSRQKNDQIPRANRTFAKDFYIHGTSPGSLVPFVTDSGKPIAVSDVVKRIKASPGWAPGVPVRLVSCHSAKSGAASAVAAQLKTPVMAPTHRVSIGSDGSFRFHGDRLPPDPTDLDASGTPRVRYADPPADAGWIRYDENGSVVGRLDMDGVWHEGGGS